MDILDLIRAFMLEQGFLYEDVSIEDRDERRLLQYKTWTFATVSSWNELFFLPFRTNHPLYINPADPNFFVLLKEALRFPEPDMNGMKLGTEVMGR